MKNTILILSVLLWSCKCQKNEVASTTSTFEEKEAKVSQNCLEILITNFKQKIQCKSGAKVSAYEFQNKMVYLFEEGPCGADITTPVYDENCNKLGELGGFLGNIKIKGVNFSEAIFKEIIWQQKPE